MTRFFKIAMTNGLQNHHLTDFLLLILTIDTFTIFFKSVCSCPVDQMSKLGIWQIQEEHHNRYKMQKIDDIPKNRHTCPTQQLSAKSGNTNGSDFPDKKPIIKCRQGVQLALCFLSVAPQYPDTKQKGYCRNIGKQWRNGCGELQ